MLRPRPGVLIRLLAPPPTFPPSHRAAPSFPLEFKKRNKDIGYYLVLPIVVFVFSSTWAAAAFVGWYAFWGRFLEGWRGGVAFGGLVGSIAEILFYLYQRHITSRIQSPAPPSSLTPDECLKFFVKMLQTGMHEEDKEGEENVPSAGEIQERLEDVMELAVRGKIDHVHSSTERASEEINPEGSTLRHRNLKSTTSSMSSEPATPSLNHDIQQNGTTTPIMKLRRLEPTDPRAIEFREKMRNWFNRVPWSSISRTHVLHWLAWSCCNLPYEEASKSRVTMMLLEASVELLEARTGTVFVDPPAEEGVDGEQHEAEREGKDEGKQKKRKEGKEGRSAEKRAHAKVRDVVKLMRLTLDPVNTRTRPFAIYLIREWAERRLRRTVYGEEMGFELFREGDLEYLLRIPKGWTPGKQETEGWDPILYIHGLGFGLISPQNIHVLQSIVTHLPNNPIIVPIQPHISMHVFHPRHLRPPSRGETVAAVRAICKRWGFWPPPANEDGSSTDGLKQDSARDDGRRGETDQRRGIAILSHSNGSIAHGWLVKDCPEMILRSALVDPVVFCLWEGDVCYNFCYREPHNAIELLLHWFIASEIGIATSIQRHFDWSANTLFHDEIPHANDPRRTLVVLGGEDVIIDAWRVKGYLNRHGMRDSILFDPLANHGEGLRGEPLERIVKFLKDEA